MNSLAVLTLAGLSLWAWQQSRKAESRAPERFTASLAQLTAMVAAGDSPDSPAYQAAVDIAYSQVAAEAMQTGGVVAWNEAEGYHVEAEANTYEQAAAEAAQTGGAVAWSSTRGYYVISQAEAIAYTM